MIAPLPYCFSIWPRARPRARCFSSLLVLAVCCAMLSPTAHVHGCWLIAQRSLITLAPRLHPTRGGRHCFIVWRGQRSSRIILQDHLQCFGHRAYPTEFYINGV